MRVSLEWATSSERHHNVSSSSLSSKETFRALHSADVIVARPRMNNFKPVFTCIVKR